MALTNTLIESPPYEVDAALKQLGANLRTARVRRRLSHQQVADKIGVSRLVVARAEEGKPTTGIVVYLALLWAYGLLGQAESLADPATDKQGLALARAREGARVRQKAALDNDF